MIKINTTYPSNNYGPFTIISKGTKYDYYRIRFHNTGTEKEYRSYQITNGCVRDPYAKSLCGIACTGNIKTKGKYKPFYSIWHDMINRCYNPKDKRAHAYKNVTVTERWLIFENFYNDMHLIEGFNENLIIQGKLVLDKDFKQMHKQNKVYSIKTCIWINKNENNLLQENQQKHFIATSPNGETYKEFNLTKFCREHNLNRNLARYVLHGRYKQTKGWKFKYYEDIV